MSSADTGVQALERRVQTTVEHMFGVHDGAEMASIRAELEPITLPGGSWLFREGDPGDSLFLIARGRLQVWRDSEEPGGKAHLLGELGPGESVGELSLLTGDPRSASIRAIRDTLLLRMDRLAFHRLAASHPALTLQLTGQIARRLRDRTSSKRAAVRGPENLAVLRVGESEVVRGFASQLSRALEEHGSVACLDAAAARDRDELELVDWIHGQEALNDFVVLETDSPASSWSQLCRRHADVLILVADAAAPLSHGDWAEAEQGDSIATRRVLVLMHPEGEVARSAEWLKALRAKEIYHVRAAHAERDLARVARILSGEAIGLVLGGGAARGFAHVGVYRALREAKIPIDWVGGSSIGSVFAAAIAFDWDADLVESLARKAFVEENPLGDYTLPIISLLRGRRLRRLVLEHFGCDIEDLPIPYFCVSSHLDRGELLVHDRGPLWRAVRASVALPGVLPPGVVDGFLAIDGGVLNNLPVDVMKSRSVGSVIAVDLSVRKERRVEYDEVPDPFEVLRGRLLPFSKRPSRAPNIVSLMMKASLVASSAHSRAMLREADLVLQPPVGRFGLLDVKAFDQLVEVGYQHARERLADWKPQPAR
jgi:predicted acylesterase/phospholipase RssA/CRP-like cAMP-binding protein